MTSVCEQLDRKQLLGAQGADGLCMHLQAGAGAFVVKDVLTVFECWRQQVARSAEDRAV